MITEEEKEKLYKMLMNAYVFLCKAEKLLKGSEDNGKRTEPKADT